MSKEPLRRCLVCRQSGKKTELVRFVVSGSCLVWDEAMNMGGRGAYVHGRAECLSGACDGGRWEHALRVRKGSLDVTAVRLLIGKVVDR